MSKKQIPCRYCKQEVDDGVKRCPHCGTHNPTIGVKKAMVWTVSAIVVLYVVTFLVEVLRK
ncbi:hypothetical protein MNB_SV-10-115 [hydrothermal vent metagenome]|uniref:Uncharacterized protein n=1 Tax=hydrothermal vent metagenome TaxID=652676 RepID=A0A1W1BW29_9ZZZZ